MGLGRHGQVTMVSYLHNEEMTSVGTSPDYYACQIIPPICMTTCICKGQKMKKALLFAIFTTAIFATPALADGEVDFFTNGFVAQPLSAEAPVGAALTGEPSFLAPPQQFDMTSLAPATDAAVDQPAADTSLAGTAYDNASQGDAMHTSSATGTGPQGTAARTTNTTGKQNAPLNLPVCCYGIL
jgi:hypothetical protein